MPKLHDTFDVYDDHVIVHSKSGATYLITITQDDLMICSCPGFTFRSDCRHVNEIARQTRSLKYLRTTEPTLTPNVLDKVMTITHGKNWRVN